MRRADAVGGVLDRRRPTRLDAEPAHRLEVNVGLRLSAGHLLGRDCRLEQPGEPRPREDGVDERPVRRGGDAEPERARQATHGVDRPGHDRKLVCVAALHPADDLVVDLLRRLGQPDDLVHVARPLRRAHAHHVRLRAVVPAAATLVRERFAHLVPDVLGVHEHAVEVEDDGPDR